LSNVLKESDKLKFVEHYLRPSCFCQWAALEDGERRGDANRTAADENGKQ